MGTVCFVRFAGAVGIVVGAMTRDGMGAGAGGVLTGVITGAGAGVITGTGTGVITGAGVGTMTGC